MPARIINKISLREQCMKSSSYSTVFRYLRREKIENEIKISVPYPLTL